MNDIKLVRQASSDYFDIEYKNHHFKQYSNNAQITLDIINAYALGGCCDQLTLSSSGATLHNHLSILGTYRKDGLSNGRDLYKNINDKELQLHFTQNSFWMVRI